MKLNNIKFVLSVKNMKKINIFTIIIIIYVILQKHIQKNIQQLFYITSNLAYSDVEVVPEIAGHDHFGESHLSCNGGFPVNEMLVVAQYLLVVALQRPHRHVHSWKRGFF